MASLTNTSITIGGVTITHTSSYSKYVIIKYDATGNGVWIKEIPFVFQLGANTNPHKFIHHNGNLYLFTAYDQNNIIMDGFHFPPRPANLGIGNLVLIKMDAQNGATEWIQTMVRPDGFQSIPLDGFEIYIDQQDNIHAMGTFSTTVIFDNGNTLSNTGNTSGKDAFHAIYDTAGNLKSAHRLGVINSSINFYSHEYFYMDGQKNIYRFVKDTKTFIKYNEQGDTLFTKTFSSGAAITGMTVDPWQNVFLSGYFSSSTVSFDGLSTSKAGGTTDAILIKFNSNDGTVEWLKNLGDPVCDRFDFINSDAIGNIYTLNNQYGNCATPGASLIVKYNNDGNLIWQKNIETHPGGNPALFPMVSAGNISLSPDGGTIIVTGSSTFSQNDKKGFIAQYGICNTPEPMLTISNAHFCPGDSAMLDISPISGYGYLWSNGDTTNTTIYATSSGKYSVVAIQDEECYAESQAVLITENTLPDTTTIQSGITLIAVSGYTYQWLDCNNNYASIEGANAVSFTPEQNGMYAVRVTSSEGCTDTSSCYLINTLGLEQTGLIHKYVSIFPNPATEEITIQGNLEVKTVKLLDLQGKQVLTATNSTVNISSLAAGVYIVDIVFTDNSRGKNKVVKE